MKIPANRIAVYITGLSALAAASAPAVANLDLQSTGGVVAGIAALTAVVNVWLRGWQQHESSTFYAARDDAHQAKQIGFNTPVTATKAGAVEGSS